MIGASAASMMSGASAPDLFLPARRLLASTPVTSIMHTRHAGTQWRPLILYGDNTIAEALGKLAKRELLSAPVMMAPVAPAHAEGLAGVSGTALTDHADPSVFSSFLGFVGVEDIVAALCDTAVRRMQITVPISAGPGTPEFWQAVLRGDAGFEWLHKRLDEIAFSGDGGLMFSGSAPDHNLLRTCYRGMLYGGPQDAEGNTRIIQPCFHRFAIFDTDGSIVDIISQHDIVRFMQSNVHRLGALADASLESLGFVTDDVVTVPASLPALEAFAQLNKRRVTSMAVVDDEHGSLLSCLSGSDLRGIDVNHLEWLTIPVGEYLSIVHGLDYAGYQTPHHTRAYKDNADPYLLQPRRKEPQDSPEGRAEEAAKRRDRSAALPACMRRAAHDAISLPPSSPFKDALNLLAKRHVHRIYVKHPVTNRPVGVVSLTDVLRMAVGDEKMDLEHDESFAKHALPRTTS